MVIMKVPIKHQSVLFLVLICTIGCTKSGDLLYNLSFPVKPTVITYAPENVTTCSASLGGQIINTGRGIIWESGIYIHQSGGPVVPGSAPVPEFVEKRYSEDDNDEFIILLTDLNASTTYHYCAFATNEAGTSYGKMRILVTSHEIISDHDGNTYQTVKIGKQVWMRENLKTKKYPDETPIEGLYSLSNDYFFGAHYNWQAATRCMLVSSDVCPDGWHIPSDEEWQELFSCIGIPADQFSNIGLLGKDQARMLKAAGSGYWKDKEIKNSTGFSVLPAGICSEEENSGCLRTAFWTSTPYIFYGFMEGSEKIMRGKSQTGRCGFSVRCIKNLH